MLTALLFVVCQQDPDLATMVATARIPMVRAIELARAEVDGTAVQAELEFERSHVAWSVDVAHGKKSTSLLLDAVTGAVLAREDENADFSALVAAARVGLADAVASVMAAHQGTAVQAELRTPAAQASIVVTVYATGETRRFALDAHIADSKPADTPVAPAPSPLDGGPRFTDAFGEDDADLGPTGRNPYLVLEPGYALVLEGVEHKSPRRTVIKVLDETITIGDITARVVEERESSGDQVLEVTRDYLAISRRTNNVYYLGEDVDEYEDGRVVKHSGTWHHGIDGARYGLMMPGVPLLGARFQQELAPRVAMDRCEILDVAAHFECPAGRFDQVLVVRESTPLESSTEDKHYAPGVGLLQDGGLLLVRYGPGADTK